MADQTDNIASKKQLLGCFYMFFVTVMVIVDVFLFGQAFRDYEQGRPNELFGITFASITSILCLTLFVRATKTAYRLRGIDDRLLVGWHRRQKSWLNTAVCAYAIMPVTVIWLVSSRPPTWQMPDPRSYRYITGTLLGEESTRPAKFSLSWGNIRSDDGMKTPFVCSPEGGDTSCLTMRFYQKHVGRRVRIALARIQAARGTSNVVMGIWNDGGGEIMPPRWRWNDLQRQLAADHRARALPNFGHIFAILVFLGTVFSALFERTGHSDDQPTAAASS